MAGEPESLDQDEPLAAHLQRHDYDRLLMLSDGVFAIAITLLALDLKPPASWDGRMSTFLQGLGHHGVAYAAGFFVVAVFWLLHRRLFARLRRVDRVITGLALLLLCLVTGAPMVAQAIADHGLAAALPLYVLLVAAIAGCQALMWAWAMGVPGAIHPALGIAERRRELLRFSLPAVVFGCLFGASATGLVTIAADSLAAAAVALAIGRAILLRRR